MHTTTKTITTVALVELREALRPHLAACGLDADRMIFPMQELKHLEVASVYDLNSPPDGTLVDLIKYHEVGYEVAAYMVAEWIAMLADEGEFGDKAWPKTDYSVTY